MSAISQETHSFVSRDSGAQGEAQEVKYIPRTVSILSGNTISEKNEWLLQHA